MGRRLAEAYPAVLDVDGFEKVLADAKRLLPNMDIQLTLNTDPDFIFRLQSGAHMIPYDPVP